jgi:hypothetical protein
MCKHSFDQLNLSFSHFHGLENFWQSWFMSLHHNIFLQFHKLPVPKRKNVHLLLKLCIVVQCHTTFSVCLVVQCHNTSKLCLVVWCHTITWAFPFNVRWYFFTRFHKWSPSTQGRCPLHHLMCAVLMVWPHVGCDLWWSACIILQVIVQGVLVLIAYIIASLNSSSCKLYSRVSKTYFWRETKQHLQQCFWFLWLQD